MKHNSFYGVFQWNSWFEKGGLNRTHQQYNNCSSVFKTIVCEFDRINNTTYCCYNTFHRLTQRSQNSLGFVKLAPAREQNGGNRTQLCTLVAYFPTNRYHIVMQFSSISFSLYFSIYYLHKAMTLLSLRRVWNLVISFERSKNYLSI